MVKAGAAVDEAIDSLSKVLEPGDTIIDGGNSLFHDTRRRAAAVEKSGLGFIGAGVSGGEEGALRGPSIMPGGTRASYERVAEMLTAISAKVDGTPCCTYIGPDGAGHFVKMVHNGIEYGMMGAYAEGLNILKHAGVGRAAAAAADAETTPLRDPAAYQYDLSLPDIAEVWRRGSVIASWLLDLTSAALATDANLDRFQGRVSDSGEGRWTLEAAIDEAVPANVLAAALFARFTSRGQADFPNRLLSAMRSEFGGHAEKTDGT
jgi:6-phosphogluconate dehydrogenase